MVPERAGPYVVVCGSYRSATRASTERKRLADLDRDARVISVRIPERGIWHRVVIGLSHHEDGARALAKEVVAAGEVQSAQIVAMEGIGMTIGPPLVPENESGSRH
jgi:cell division protein FtsN